MGIVFCFQRHTGDPAGEAQKEYLKVRNNFAGQIDRGELEPVSVKTFTIGELLADYLKHVETNGRKSADIVRLVVGKVQKDRTFIPTRKVAKITTADFKNYRERGTLAGCQCDHQLPFRSDSRGHETGDETDPVPHRKDPVHSDCACG